VSIVLPSGPAGARILSLGDYRPTRVVGNDEIARRVWEAALAAAPRPTPQWEHSRAAARTEVS